MKWADSAGVSYLAWGWIVEPQDEQNADGCSAFYLIDNYTNYKPAKPNGVRARLGDVRRLRRPQVHPSTARGMGAMATFTSGESR